MDFQATSLVSVTQCDPTSGIDPICWPATVTDDVSCAAQRLAPQERQDLAIQVLAGTETVSELARQHEVSRKFLYQQGVTVAREVLQVLSLPTWDPMRCRREAALRETLPGRYHGVCADVQELSNQVVRASSMVENLNSRLRNYFFLRRQLGKDYLTLLQFFLNHRRYLRSGDPSRVGKSPAELLTGQRHAHWLELLGYTRLGSHGAEAPARQPGTRVHPLPRGTDQGAR